MEKNRKTCGFVLEKLWKSDGESCGNVLNKLWKSDGNVMEK